MTLKNKPTGLRQGGLLVLVSFALARTSFRVNANELDTASSNGLRQLYGESSRDRLRVGIDGSNFRLNEEPLQFSYGLMGELGAASHEISDDGCTIQLEGDSFIAYKLPYEYKIRDNTILKFDFSVFDEEDVHAICFRYNSDSLYVNGKISLSRCFLLSGTQKEEKKSFFGIGFPLKTTNEGETTSYEIKVGHYLQNRAQYIFFINNSSSNKGRGKVVYKNLQIFEDPSPARLVVNVHGSDTTIDHPPLRYGYQGLDRSGANSYSLSNNGEKLTLRGNSWKAFPIDEYAVNENTVLEFGFILTTEVNLHAICLVDAIFVDEFDGTGCFRLAGTVYSEDFDGVPLAKTSEGETKSYKVKVGEYFQRDVNFLLFVSSAPKEVGLDKGLVSFESIKLYDEVSSLVMTVNSVSQRAGDSLPYGTVAIRRAGGNLFSLSNMGKKITLKGQMSRAFSIGQQEVVDNTVLEFSFSVATEDRAHAICLDSAVNTAKEDFSEKCFLLSGSEMDGDSGKPWRYILNKTEEGQNNFYSVEVGHYFMGPIEYISFVSLSKGNSNVGDVAFEDIKFYRKKSASRLRATLGGNTQRIGYPVSYGDREQFEDLSGQNQYVIGSGGLKITLHGNAWKAFPISYNIRRNTVLQFAFLLSEKSNFHAICLDDNLDHTYQLDVTQIGHVETDFRVVDRCFVLASRSEPCSTETIDVGGTKKLKSRCWSFKGGESQEVGTNVEYSIDVGNYFTGKVGYLALVTDGHRGRGEATFRNIVLFDD